ncbi:hypothetical protein LR48_Vigan02g087300 [Vigna angularis]|uniref:Uncharacterized protein n=1 Tax=Phaseolus angularis TaxID=3914 RepID=A0A0L9TVV4_PHAAN|nr:hypothetical protein LR48_Vigan02g087300 [Vigna angularis]
MTPIEIKAVKTIDALSRRLSARNLVECLGHEDFDQMAFDIMSLPQSRKTSYISSSRKRDPRSGGSSHGLTATQSRTVTDPPMAVVVAQSAPMVNLESSEVAVVPSATLLDKKKRKSKKGEKSSSKQSRREGSVPHPLPGSLFELTFNVGGDNS